MKRKELKGSLMVLTAGFSWGVSGISGEYLMSHGVNVIVLASLRLLVTGVFLLGMAYGLQRDDLMRFLKSRSAWLSLLAFCLTGLMLNQYAFLQAIHYSNAGTATVLQYTTPVLLLVYTCLKDRVLPTMVEVVSIGLAMIGTLIMATHGDLSQLSLSPAGLFWGILSAFTYAAYILIPAKIIQEYGSIVVLGVGSLLGGSLFSLVTQSWRYDIAMTFSNLPAYIGIVGIGTIFAYTVFLKGTTLIGAVKGSLLAAVEPISAILLSVIIMKNHFHLIDLVGMFAIILAVILISLRNILIDEKESPND